MGLTDASGAVTASYGYGVLGELRNGTLGASDRLFTGEQRDADSGLYYLRARYYDPSIGRFLSQDPLPVGHPYAYVGNNPLNRTDPTGLRWWTDKEGPNFGPTPRGAPDPGIMNLPVCKGVTPQGCTGNVQYPCTGGVPQTCQPPGASSSGFFKTILEALTSDCAQGFAAIAGLTVIAVVSVGSGAAFVEAGGVLTYSASAAATSAAAAGAGTLGPVASHTLNQAINLALTTRKVESCAP